MTKAVRYLIAALVLALVVFVSWPYVYLYRIDAALAENDMVTLGRLVDLDAVRAEMKRSIDRDVQQALGEKPGSILGWLKDKVNEIGARAIDDLVDLEWVRRTLTAEGPFLERVSYAFFESWDVFLIRLGELGDGPVHVRMSFTGGNWRVTAIYE